MYNVNGMAVFFVNHNEQQQGYRYCFGEGVDKICKKVGEESTECVIAAKNRSHEELTYEAADLIYHMTVLLYEQELSWDDIGKEMLGRHKK